MSSGVAVDKDVEDAINTMQGRNKKEGQGRLKAIRLRLNESKELIRVEHCLPECDICEGEDVFKKIMDLLEEEKCCFVVYDCFYSTKEGSEKEELVLITWCPEKATVKEKMAYTSSFTALKRKCPGIKHHWQANDISDKNFENLVEKFGTKGAVAKLEGKELMGCSKKC